MPMAVIVNVFATEYTSWQGLSFFHSDVLISPPRHISLTRIIPGQFLRISAFMAFRKGLDAVISTLPSVAGHFACATVHSLPRST